MSANVGLQTSILISVETSPQLPRNQSISWGLCSDQQLAFSPCWIEHLIFIIINSQDHQIWLKAFYFTSNFLSTVILATLNSNFSSCLETPEFGQITEL